MNPLMIALLLALAPAQLPDRNGDGKVDAFDLNIMAAGWQTEDPAGDANGDGFVDAIDVNILAAHWQEVHQEFWSYAPDQAFNNFLYPGVIPFHPNGVEHVEYKLGSVTAFVYPLGDGTHRVVYPGYDEVLPDEAPDTHVPSLWIRLYAGDSPNGYYLLPARVYPVWGEPIDVPPLYFYLWHWNLPQAQIKPQAKKAPARR